MIAGQALNKNEKPIYGIYITGVQRRFVILSGTEWCESEPLISTYRGILDIFRILKCL
jgi:hypothetical protein